MDSKGTNRPAAVTVVLEGEIDMSNAAAVRCRLDHVVARHPGATVVVDVARVTFLGAAALDALVAARRAAVAAGGSIVVAHAAPRVRRVFAATGLAGAFGLE